ncbi:hypothetical protein HYPSUDRAFT_61189 [Hypholoma sublateritium FD-334 SS-4]|uniref:Phosphatidylglycerol/phosphatidylinositol transfer protein n=1 Tax=Hypholoma sublateritium (strain FD-334 SS-4) TaxID=945553 RepID=A0A0D2LME0_HYPSF|nr:hypothetical protein HYPSUDRAFT_61189 [Hypholoma sublateritium FD-334 SS-4]
MPGQQPLDVQSGPIRTAAGWEWQDCGLDTDAVKIESIEVSPDPPEPGKDMTVKVKGIAREVIEDGASADVTVKLGLIKILQKTFDICEEARTNNASIQCPVSEGTHIVEQTVALPKEIPKAKFVVDVNGYTASDDDMFCLKLTVDFMKRPFPPFW